VKVEKTSKAKVKENRKPEY